MGMLSIDDVVAIIFFTILMFGLVSLIHKQIAREKGIASATATGGGSCGIGED
jgi:hypothetical protein